MARASETNPATTVPTDKGGRPRVLERRLETWHRQWAEVRRLAGEIHDAGEQILAAGEQVAADAYPSSLRGQEGRGAGDHPDPTLATVERDAGGTDDEADTWQAPPDAVAEWVRELTLTTSEVRGHMRRLGRLTSMVKNRSDPRVMDSGGYCLACDRYCSGAADDRLRSGLCDGMARNQPGGGSCYRAWLEWRQPYLDRGDSPSRHLFSQWRKNQLDDQFGKGAA